MAATKDMLAYLGSILASLMFFWAMFQQYFPYELRHHIEKYSTRLFSFFYPYIQVTFNEFTGERFMRSEAYSAIENYLSTKSSTQAKRLKADIVQNSNQSIILSMDDHEEVADQFDGVKLWWLSGKNITKSQVFSLYPNTDEKRFYKLTFHKRYRDLVLGKYLANVLKEGKAIKVRNRMRKLYTNNSSSWSHVVFQHPATFETLAMEPNKKQEIIDDLITFSKAEEFYSRIGRAWKRGYLLYGPPGTGKSTMIAAMANLLGYDIYDLELTAVSNNTELRKLLIETSSKSIIVIEDIDCSLDLTGQRRKKKRKEGDGDPNNIKDSGLHRFGNEERDRSDGQVTLSGLLNFIDGLWSACGGERLIVFTTNYVEKLDPALIRKGRMDKHIELSYCSYEAFKILAKNYLSTESHDLYDPVRALLEEVNMTPADVAEYLMPKTIPADVGMSLRSLIHGLELAKETASSEIKADEEENDDGDKEQQKETKD